MSGFTWSLADTHCVWCGKPKVTEVEWDRHRDHHCDPGEDTCWCLGWCWSCEQSRLCPPEVVAELRGLAEAQAAVIARYRTGWLNDIRADGTCVWRLILAAKWEPMTDAERQVLYPEEPTGGR